MALSHASPGQALDVRPLGARLATGKTAALFKSRDLEVLRLVAGELVFLAGDAIHGVKAVADATALVTIALKR
jgi:2-polyprenyl-6-methoxyphenol hydroxylase-like FAD-dependent oxidoreductase